MFENSVNITNKKSTDVDFTTSAGISDVVGPGTYAVWTDVDCHFSVNSDSTYEATAADDLPLTAAQSVFPVRIGCNAYFSAVGAEAGTFKYMKVD